MPMPLWLTAASSRSLPLRHQMAITSSIIHPPTIHLTAAGFQPCSDDYTSSSRWCALFTRHTFHELSRCFAGFRDGGMAADLSMHCAAKSVCCPFSSLAWRVISLHNRYKNVYFHKRWLLLLLFMRRARHEADYRVFRDQKHMGTG